MNQLPIFVNLKGRKVILLGAGEMAEAKRRLYERSGATIVDDEIADDALLAVVAIEDDAQAEAAVTRLRARGILVNAVDRPHLCDYTTPAIIDRDPVLIAIGTGGASAGLAKALRQRLEQILPSGLGDVAQALLAARQKMKALWPDAAERRRAIDAALDPGGLIDPFSDRSEEDVTKWLENPDASNLTGTIEIALRSVDPDDLTIGQARLLGQADAIYVNGDVPDAITYRARADAQILPFAKLSSTQVSGLVLIVSMSR